MQRTSLILALLVCAATGAQAQQEAVPSTQDGPMAIPVQPQVPPKPDENGVYRIGPGIHPPTLLNPEPAGYPDGATETDRPKISILAVVVGVDGRATSIHTIFQNDSVYDAGAIAAIQQSRFEPGTLDGKPVPVLVHVRVPFFHLKPAIPVVQQQYANRAEGTFQTPGRAPNYDPNNHPPHATYQPEAQFSDKARRAKIAGSVLVSTVVSADGLPTEIKVERPLGWGLDEKAVQAVSKYRFEPAMRDGSPVAQKIFVQISFRLY